MSVAHLLNRRCCYQYLYTTNRAVEGHEIHVAITLITSLELHIKVFAVDDASACSPADLRSLTLAGAFARCRISALISHPALIASQVRLHPPCPRRPLRHARVEYTCLSFRHISRHQHLDSSFSIPTSRATNTQTLPRMPLMWSGGGAHSRRRCREDGSQIPRQAQQTEIDWFYTRTDLHWRTRSESRALGNRSAFLVS